VLYKLLAPLLGMLGGLVASTLFRQLWKIVARQDDAPDPDDRSRGWPEVLAASAMQGAIFGVTQAVIRRVTAKVVRKNTGHWPGDD
jgi:hypothetical protein